MEQFTPGVVTVVITQDAHYFNLNHVKFAFKILFFA